MAPSIRGLATLINAAILMSSMSRFDRTPDHLDLDGHLLQLLLAVVETGSVTRAAQRLGVTQSAVSHLLEKLRGIVGDALFVKSGRGIVPTARALLLAEQARALLDGLRGFATSSSFDPATLNLTLTVAANDLQRDLLLPRLMRRLRARAPGLSLRVIRSNVPSAEMLREEHCQLIITPRPPEGSDIFQQRLFADHYRVFYDADARAAPTDLTDYLAAEHVSVLYEPKRALDIDQWLAAQGVQRRFAVWVPGFSGIPPFLRGSTLLATLPGLLGVDLMRGFATADVPLATPEMPMYLVWHRRHQADPVQQWLRAELLALAENRATPAAA
ncbi:MAG: hypothetical protein RLY71_1555 [Pseudomonadota bacterium]